MKGNGQDVPWEALASQVERRADQSQDVLDGDEMSHLLLGNAQDDLLPAANEVASMRRYLLATKRISGIQVLHHEAVSDLSIDVQLESSSDTPTRMCVFRCPVEPSAALLGITNRRPKVRDSASSYQRSNAVLANVARSRIAKP